MDDSKLGYSVKEAAQCLSISVWKLKEEMYQGRIKYIKIGRCVVIPAVGFGRAAEAAVDGTGG